MIISSLLWVELAQPPQILHKEWNMCQKEIKVQLNVYVQLNGLMDVQLEHSEMNEFCDVAR